MHPQYSLLLVDMHPSVWQHPAFFAAPFSRIHFQSCLRLFWLKLSVNLLSSIHSSPTRLAGSLASLPTDLTESGIQLFLVLLSAPEKHCFLVAHALVLGRDTSLPSAVPPFPLTHADTSIPAPWVCVPSPWKVHRLPTTSAFLRSRDGFEVIMNHHKDSVPCPSIIRSRARTCHLRVLLPTTASCLPLEIPAGHGSLDSRRLDSFFLPKSCYIPSHFTKWHHPASQGVTSS